MCSFACSESGSCQPFVMKPTLNIPNAITASRILLTPLFLWLLLSNDTVLVQIAAAVFLVAAVSDWYDGWYARRYNAMSAFGTFFDPLADKIFIGAAFFAFVALDVLELWMVIIIVGRDLLTTVLRIIADRRGSPVVTSRLAKWKTGLQLVFLWYVVAAWTLNNIESVRAGLNGVEKDVLLSPWVLHSVMVVLVLLSLITAVLYIIENRHVFRLSGGRNVARTPS